MVTRTLDSTAIGVLESGAPATKIAASRAAVAAWRNGELTLETSTDPMPVPDRPARPARPKLRRPGEMPKRRRAGSRAGRIALLHAVAHIEFNAIDLAWDLIARYGGAVGETAFVDDWVLVADEETSHFELLAGRLADHRAAYGDLPAHDGLWEAATATRADLLARLAVVPLVLEARGLDVTPNMIAALSRAGDQASADVLARIYDDEIGHVRIGKCWFDRLCRARGYDPATIWADLVARHFKGVIKGPFNADARGRAGLAPDFYDPAGNADSSNAST